MDFECVEKWSGVVELVAEKVLDTFMAPIDRLDGERATFGFDSHRRVVECCWNVQDFYRVT